ncbi:hypothetical protein BA81_01825 [Bacillus safensis FO-36b]|nr:hypothetical protein [Bacillus safensis]KDE29191.1 hypothetical protein BA81_01825 [Bacillus safensis FO-36b]
MLHFQGKTVIITGAANGIGFSINVNNKEPLHKWDGSLLCNSH